MTEGAAGLRISVMTGEDAAEAARLEAMSFPDPWSEESLRSTLSGRAAYYIKAELDGTFVGYCGTQIVLDEGEILRIAVDDRYRGRGIGSAIMTELLEKNPEVVLWFLDVRESNEPAQELYRKHGFKTIGRRKKYYHLPEEDAILMQRNQ